MPGMQKTQGSAGRGALRRVLGTVRRTEEAVNADPARKGQDQTSKTGRGAQSGLRMHAMRQAQAAAWESHVPRVHVESKEREHETEQETRRVLT